MPKKQTPRTSMFEKVIVTEGNYDQVDRVSGKKTVRHVSKLFLEGIVTTFNTMKAKGLKVPAPWKHDFDITTFTKLEEGKAGLLEDSTKNAGFWDSLFTRINDEGKLELVGKIEAPGDPNNPETPAGKIGTQVKDTSIYVRDNFPMTDGSGEVLKNALMHIALVTHPIEKGQKNFELQENDSYIAMSELIPGDLLDSAPISDLVGKLKKVCKLYLPNDTTMQSLVPNLLIAINQCELMSEEDDTSSSSNSENSKIQVEPVIMSMFDTTQIDALVATKAINPKTNKPFCKEDFDESKVTTPVVMSLDPQQTLIMSAMQTTMQSDRRKGYRSRIDGLVESQRTTKSFADSSLYPTADAYEIKFSNGQIETPSIETVIMSLEAAPAPNKETLMSDLHVGQGLDSFSEDDFTAMDKIADEMAGLV